MSNNGFQHQPDFNSESDTIEEGLTTSNVKQQNSSRTSISSFSGTMDELSPDEERLLAGYDQDALELLASEYRIKQDDEQVESRELSQKPSVRMFSVLTGTGFILGVFGFLWFVFFAPKPVAQQPKTSKPEVTTFSPKNESGELKSQLAFQDQQRTLNAQSPTPKKPPTSNAAPPSKPKPTPASNSATPQPVRPVQAAPPPRPRTVQVVPPPVPPAPAPRPVPAPRPAPTVASRPSNPRLEEVDPYQRWAELASLGQSQADVTDYPAIARNSITPPPFGMTTAVAAPTSIPQTEQFMQISSPTISSPKQSEQHQEIKTVVIGNPSPERLTSASRVDEMSAGEIGILNRTTLDEKGTDYTSPKQIAIGSSVKGKVIVPMIWDETNQSPTAGRFAVELTENLLASDGAIALPTGTILITEVDNVTPGNRLVSQSAVAIVYPDSTGNIQQMPIPEESLLIRGSNNKPLIAQGLFDRGSTIAKTDILVGVLSSLGRVGQIINQPTQRTLSQHSGLLGSSSVETLTGRAQPNILATALEGFFTPTAQRLRERSDQTLEELMKRGNVAIVPEGTEVSIFVNAFITIN